MAGRGVVLDELTLVEAPKGDPAGVTIRRKRHPAALGAVLVGLVLAIGATVVLKLSDGRDDRPDAAETLRATQRATADATSFGYTLTATTRVHGGPDDRGTTVTYRR